MAQPVILGSGEGQSEGNPVGGQVIFKVRGEHSGGSLTAFETVVAPGEGPPLHRHAGEDESLYVVAGQVRFRVGEALHAGGPGTFVFVPRGTAHTFQNIGDEPATMLIHFSPSGMELFFDRFAAVDGHADGTFARIAAGVGMTVVGPPLGQAAD